VADDQMINLEAIKLNLESIGITRNVSYCSDGLIASDTAIELLKAAKAKFSGEKLRPIAAMLLDIQMPMKSGLRVVEEVRAFCEENSDKLHQPTFIFLSSYITPDFKMKIEA